MTFQMIAKLADRPGLGETGSPLDQQVAISEQGNKKTLKQNLLAKDLFAKGSVEPAKTLLDWIHIGSFIAKFSVPSAAGRRSGPFRAGAGAA